MLQVILNCIIEVLIFFIKFKSFTFKTENIKSWTILQQLLKVITDVLNFLQLMIIGQRLKTNNRKSWEFLDGYQTSTKS